MLRKAVTGCYRFLRDERGLETVEYAVLTVLLLIGTVLAISALGGAVGDRYDSAASTINS